MLSILGYSKLFENLTRCISFLNICIENVVGLKWFYKFYILKFKFETLKPLHVSYFLFIALSQPIWDGQSGALLYLLIQQDMGSFQSSCCYSLFK